jgi:hypothetical protein
MATLACEMVPLDDSERTAISYKQLEGDDVHVQSSNGYSCVLSQGSAEIVRQLKYWFDKRWFTFAPESQLMLRPLLKHAHTLPEYQHIHRLLD